MCDVQAVVDVYKTQTSMGPVKFNKNIFPVTLLSCSFLLDIMTFYLVYFYKKPAAVLIH